MIRLYCRQALRSSFGPRQQVFLPDSPLPQVFRVYISPAKDDSFGKVKTLCVNFNMIRPDKKIITLSPKPIKVVDFKSVQLENDFFDISKYALKPMIRKYKLCKIMKTVIDIYSKDSENVPMLQKSVKYLEEHYAENFKMSFLAEKFN